MDDFVRLEVDDGVGVIRVDRPPANAISHDVGLRLGEVIEEAAGREDVGALVLWGGQRLFAAGADIKEMVRFGPEQILPVVSALGDAIDALEALPKISIAAVTGYALGGGLELALGADLRYLATDATIGQPEVKIGVMPGAGGTQRLTRLLGPARAGRLIYTGEQIDAGEAHQLGLADRVLPTEELLAAAIQDARAFARGPRLALAAAKEAIRAAVHTPGPAGLARERELFCGLFGSPDQLEGMQAFLDRRPPSFGGEP
ncbi:MAG: enoyl-CoA hydratase-related protein [Actinomycetota bacterium]